MRPSLQHSALAALAVLLLCGWRVPRPIVPPPRPPQPLRLPRPLPRRVLDVPILMYHRISTDAAGIRGLTVAPAQFAAEMDWLHRAGFHAITQRQLFAALERGRPLPSRPLLITFDDGYRDVLWQAAPLLHRLRMPATVFVITDRVDGGDPSFLSWPELRRLERLGFTVGSHTVHHRALPLLSPAQARAELVGSQRTLARHLGHPVQWLSYPAGAVDGRVVELARAAGYVLAVTTRPGSAQSAAEPLLLHRDEILPSTGVAGVRALVESVSR